MKKKIINASITVEAALVLPLFLIFSIQLFSLFEILTLYTKLQAACEETAVEAATVLALPEEKKLSDMASFLLSETLIREEIMRKANLKDSADSLIVGGFAGLHLFRSDLATDAETVEIILTYRVKPRFCPDLFGLVTLVNHSKVRAWTGFTKKTGEEDSGENTGKTVYVTESGEVYHLYEDCSYLKADVKSASGEEIKKLRSKDRKIYYPCEYCAAGAETEEGKTYYYTPWGERYHTDSKCVALEKNFRAISIDDVGSRHLCSKCEKRSLEEGE